MEQDNFDWGELPREWWVETALQCGATEKHARFAAAKHRGATNTDAARSAAYGTGSEASAVAKATALRAAPGLCNCWRLLWRRPAVVVTAR